MQRIAYLERVVHVGQWLNIRLNRDHGIEGFDKGRCSEVIESFSAEEFNKISFFFLFSSIRF